MAKVKYDYEKIIALTKKPKERSWNHQAGEIQLVRSCSICSHFNIMDDLRVDCCTEDFAISKVLFNLDSLEAWGHETIMS